MNRRSLDQAARWLAALALCGTLASCAGPGGPGPAAGGTDAAVPAPGVGEGPAAASAQTGCPRPGGGYYLDDGPGCTPPQNLQAIPDAVPRPEALLPRTARPYVVFGRQYRPMARLEPYKARGEATWYGRRYHGRPTSSGEPYDMYAMTAAHPTLPIPSYVRVTHLGNGRSVVVRVNDRGPFLNNRLIDLSYTAAAKLGYIEAGSARVEVELITEFEDAPGLQAAATPPAIAPRPVLAPAVASTAPAPAGSQGTGPVAAAAPPEAAPASGETSAPPSPPAGQPALVAGAATAGADTEPSGAPPAAPARSGHWLQFGAFGSADNAEAALARLAGRLPALEAPFDVLADGGLYKLQAGPWPSRSAALAAVERLRGLPGIQVFATQREP